MKKLFIIIVLMFILTGCNNKLSIDFDENIDASIEFSFDLDDYNRYNVTNYNEDDLKGEIEALLTEIRPINDNYSEMYNEVKNEVYNNHFDLEYQYSYTYDNFMNNSLFKRCFENAYVGNEDDKIIVYLKGNNSCGPFNLVVSANGRMISNNANDYSKDEYVWNIADSDNDVQFIISKDVISRKGLSFGSVFSIIVAIILFLGVYFWNKKIKNNN